MDNAPCTREIAQVGTKLLKGKHLMIMVMMAMAGWHLLEIYFPMPADAVAHTLQTSAIQYDTDKMKKKMIEYNSYESLLEIYIYIYIYVYIYIYMWLFAIILLCGLSCWKPCADLVPEWPQKGGLSPCARGGCHLVPEFIHKYENNTYGPCAGQPCANFFVMNLVPTQNAWHKVGARSGITANCHIDTYIYIYIYIYILLEIHWEIILIMNLGLLCCIF